MQLNAEIILITDGGVLQCGTEEEPFQHQATIMLHGHARDPELPIYGTKVLAIRLVRYCTIGIILPNKKIGQVSYLYNCTK